MSKIDFALHLCFVLNAHPWLYPWLIKISPLDIAFDQEHQDFIPIPF